MALGGGWETDGEVIETVYVEYLASPRYIRQLKNLTGACVLSVIAGLIITLDSPTLLSFTITVH